MFLNFEKYMGKFKVHFKHHLLRVGRNRVFLDLLCSGCIINVQRRND